MEEVPEEGKGASEMIVIKELVADSSQCMELLKFITDNPSHSVPLFGLQVSAASMAPYRGSAALARI